MALLFSISVYLSFLFFEIDNHYPLNTFLKTFTSTLPTNSLSRYGALQSSYLSCKYYFLILFQNKELFLRKLTKPMLVWQALLM